MHEQDRRLHELLEPAVTVLGYELVAVQYLPKGRPPLLRIYIDSEQGISLDDCERVSHQVSGVLDVEDPIRGEYSLEVSSPGLDRPLCAPADFERFKGRQVKILLNVPVEGRRRYRGELQGLRDDKIMLQDGDSQYLLPLAMVGSARLVPDL
jgi:ribosome maturation factor RimP